MINDGDIKEWKNTFKHYDSRYLRSLKIIIDDIIKDREEFF